MIAGDPSQWERSQRIKIKKELENITQGQCNLL